jgi:hypothetical protein
MNDNCTVQGRSRLRENQSAGGDHRFGLHKMILSLCVEQSLASAENHLHVGGTANRRRRPPSRAEESVPAET